MQTTRYFSSSLLKRDQRASLRLKVRHEKRNACQPLCEATNDWHRWRLPINSKLMQINTILCNVRLFVTLLRSSLKPQARYACNTSLLLLHPVRPVGRGSLFADPTRPCLTPTRRNLQNLDPTHHQVFNTCFVQ
jgi:hypothetical protein